MFETERNGSVVEHSALCSRTDVISPPRLQVVRGGVGERRAI